MEEDGVLVFRSYTRVIGLIVESEETGSPVFEINGSLSVERTSAANIDTGDFIKATIVNNKIVLYNDKGLEIPRD